MITHDPREFVRQLQQILISDKKRIGFLAGAGTSMLKEKINPTPQDKDGKDKFISLVAGTKEITDIIVDSYGEKPYKSAIDLIKAELVLERENFHIENLLSKISLKEKVVGNEKLCGLTKEQLKKWKEEIELKIKRIVSIHEDVLFSTYDLTHYKFINWINDAVRKSCVEIFTTNYDYLFEIALEKYNVPYFDGFIGSYEPFFSSGVVEDDHLLNGWTKLWKIHGSLGWIYDEKIKKITRGDRDSGKIMVYPSILKYDHSKKQPYLSFMDRLNRFIKADDSLLLVCGYAFGDQHINENIITALSKARTSSAIAFLYDDFDETHEAVKLAKSEPRLSVYGWRKAVIGGKLGKWKFRTIPPPDDDIQMKNYFLMDAPSPKEESGKGDEELTLEGDFILVDFSKLVNFLSELNHSNYRFKK